MDLRGVARASSPLDLYKVYHHNLPPPYLAESMVALNLTDEDNSRSWAITQTNTSFSQEWRKHANVWHVEARQLPSGGSYTVSNAGNLSNHTYSIDASRCYKPPAVFRPGSVWTVIVKEQYDLDMHAQAVAEHTSYHQALGVSDAVLVLSRTKAATLMRHPAMQPGLAAGAYVIIVWDGDLTPGLPAAYYQPLWYNLVLLATWGTQNIRLAIIDLDEYYVLPAHMSISQAFGPGGCLEKYQQARITRHDIFFGIHAADARACNDNNWQTRKQQKRQRAAARNAKHNITRQDNQLPDAVGQAKHAVNGSTQEGADLAEDNLASLAATSCAELQERMKLQAGGGDIHALLRLGWRQLFTQELYYIDSMVTTGPRFSHKSFVDPNTVAAFIGHEANHMLDGGYDGTVPEDCAFGLHLTNLLRFRKLGSGSSMSEAPEAPFNLTAYMERFIAAVDSQSTG